MRRALWVLLLAAGCSNDNGYAGPPGGDLPAPTAAIGIAMPLGPRLSELSHEELDLLQLVHNYGVVQAVLDRASGSDLEVSEKLLALLQRGYLRQF